MDVWLGWMGWMGWMGCMGGWEIWMDGHCMNNSISINQWSVDGLINK